jgi:hypothetical protein
MNRRLLLGITALAAIGLIVTVSFTPIAGAIVGSLLLAITGGAASKWVLRVGGLVVLLTIAFAPLLTSRYHEQFATPHAPVKQIPLLPQNFNFRVQVWRTEFIPVLAKHITTGYGPEPPPRLAFSFTESIYITLMLRGGLPLLLLYGGLMLTLALEARARRDDPNPERAAIARLMFIVIVLTVFMEVPTNYFVNAGFPFLLWTLAALMMGGKQRRGLAPLRARGSGGGNPRSSVQST